MNRDLDSLRQGFSNLLAEKDDMNEFFGQVSSRRLSVVEEPRLPTNKELGTLFRLNVKSDASALKEINARVTKLEPPVVSHGTQLQRLRVGNSWFYRVEMSSMPDTVFMSTDVRHRALLVELVRTIGGV